MKKALTIAGSDSSGGAGIQADLKTFQELNVYGMTALTTIVSMDPDNNWHHNVFPQELGTVEAQLKTIVSVGVDAVKTGMLGSPDIIGLAAKTIKENQLPNVVIDPVMVCKGAEEVLHPENTDALRDVLVPTADVATPNLFEAAFLANQKPITTVDDMKEAAKKIHDTGAKHVLIKGGSKLEHKNAIDLFYDGNEFSILDSEKIDTPYTHGAGCTYSAAITASLAQGKSVREAIETAKAFITEAIRHSFRLNEYVGPTNHASYKQLVSSR
ncbi:pyridoxine/pyridoxal/pyridoxamine kinase [Alkalihalobacillus sp. AL-G]|uniref:pyridoxine/pyridoxal/pyridoxamine kinase n=1 Tax=Alkalihalobacillus sp. AL-G TaxID=2926399 RepID=UPI00272D2B7F|nr:pyridoxine/pyridoxal/pyridoxamine kinase [Alkalihalobacillus sp. AL-G]WLD93256.1 pyridoxine/pyridoxal/pyridoxamine kinase [Alkalihalobacillus sp. AL-G]